jgi:hypothetical protein
VIASKARRPAHDSKEEAKYFQKPKLVLLTLDGPRAAIEASYAAGSGRLPAWGADGGKGFCVSAA